MKFSSKTRAENVQKGNEGFRLNSHWAAVPEQMESHRQGCNRNATEKLRFIQAVSSTAETALVKCFIL